jgi:hypothetical protein
MRRKVPVLKSAAKSRQSITTQDRVMVSKTEIEKRKALRREYGTLFDTLAKLLFDSDPIGINFETNTDEYEPEVGTIIPRLKHATSENEVRQLVYEEFCRWFDAETAGPIDGYTDIASEVWAEWQRYK